MDNKKMKEMWEGREGDVLYRLMQERIKSMRLSELNSDTLRKRVGEEAKRLMIPRETLLNVTKFIVRQTLNETLSELDKLELSRK